tara:strand:+ start:6522 stop:7166 length:645 start_codon:yes stop_codon:yes gene_type:complete
MTGDALNTQLGFRMEDTAESIFTKQQKVDAINNAMVQVCALVDNSYLSELETSTTASVSSGEATYANLFSGGNPVRSSIIAVRDYSGGSDLKWCTIIDAKDVKQTDNAYLAGTTANPTVQIFDEKIHVQPSTVNQIKVWYIKSPTPYVYGTASSMDDECELNSSLEGVVLDLAESELWRSDGNLNRANGALQNGMAVIQVLNGRAGVEQPQGAN